MAMTRPRLSPNVLILGAYQTLWYNGKTYLRLAWAPFVLCGIIGIITAQFSSPQARVLGSLLFSTLFFVLLVPVVTAWHRLILLGSENKDARISYSFSREEWYYIIGIFGLYVAYFVMAVVFGSLLGPLVYGIIKVTPGALFEWLGVDPDVFGGYAVGFIVMFLAVLCLVRFLLVLPAAAIGKRMRIAESGHATEGNTWRLFYSYGVAWLPLLYIQKFHTGTPHDVVSGTATGIFQDHSLNIVVAMIPEFLFYTISVAVLSLSYKALVFTPRTAE